eukprot:844175-Alexandrium_andersonii.AAC.1
MASAPKSGPGTSLLPTAATTAGQATPAHREPLPAVATPDAVIVARAAVSADGAILTQRGSDVKARGVIAVVVNSDRATQLSVAA